MKLEQQVCNLELAKKLKELGVKQNSIWNYYYSEISGRTFLRLPDQVTGFNDDEIVFAYTVAELGELLLGRCYTFKVHLDRQIPSTVESLKAGTYWRCILSGGKIKDYIYEHTEANARAKMLIYLIENKIIEV
jgi:hypothetical protein